MTTVPPAGNSARRDLVVIGASAGGVETLKRVVARLPGDLPAAVCVVLHLAPASPSALADILGRAGPLPCRTAEPEQPLEDGQIIVAPPDRHLVVDGNCLRLTIGPRENNHRPAIDVLFRSAALSHGANVIGVVLSGTRDDGTAGLALIKQHGGLAVVQDPDDALYPDMPRNALMHVSVDAVVPSAHLGAAIGAMVNGGKTTFENLEPGGPDPDPPGEVTLICPECGGVLSERGAAGTTQWECHVGHRYSPQTLFELQGNAVEAALWTAVRELSDRSRMLHRMARQAGARGQTSLAARFDARARDAERQAGVVRRALTEATAGTLRSLAAEDETAAAAAE
jgi:two-component system chemotaxis response regulator CheB